MEQELSSKFKNAYNAFFSREPTRAFRDYGPSYSYRPDRPRFSRGNERSIVTSIYNRISLDVAANDIKHCQLDDNERYEEDRKSGLNNCLSIEANIDQTGRNLIQDIVMSMLDEGCVAVVPVDTSVNPNRTDSYDILTLRTGKVTEWFPRHVKVNVYNDRVGRKEDIMLSKSTVAIIENPFYSVMNEPNSTLQRLIRKLVLLDAVDEQSSAGKLDLIIQLPYTIKSPTRQAQAEQRKKSIEEQLSGSKYGIAYIDATEKITQLNRSLENNLLKQIEFLTSMLYGQLGINQAILDGTADEQTALNYQTRTIEPIITAIAEEMERKFLTKTARTQGQAIRFFRDPFKLVPVNNVAEIADKFTRNEIMTSNEFRQIIGMKPSKDPKADELRNSNISQSKEEIQAKMGGEVPMEEPETEAIAEENSPSARRSIMDTPLRDIQQIFKKGEIQNG